MSNTQNKKISNEDINEMPKFPGLILHKGFYYYRKRLPKELVGKVKGKYNGWGKSDVKYSLGTSNRKKALEKVPFEAIKLKQKFEFEKKVLEEKKKEAEPTKVKKLSETEIMKIVTSWFLDEEERFSDWFDKKGMYLNESEKNDVILDLQDDAGYYQGSNTFLQEEEKVNVDRDFKEILKKYDLKLDPQSKSYKKLSGLIRRGQVELAQKQIDILQKGESHKRDDFFWRHIKPNLNRTIKKPLSLEKLIKGFLYEQEKSGRSSLTLRAYNAPAGLLFDAIGKKTPISEITHQEASKVVDFIHQIPVNAKQKFGKRCGKSLLKIINFAKGNDEIQRITKTTAANYFININAIFNYAVECKYIQDNPFQNRRFRDRFNVKKEKLNKKKEQFTIDELKQIFQAPLYTGCKNDWHGFAKKGENVIKRGRFWIPLLGLFHGFRLNEICQLYTEDVIFKDRRYCIHIREELNSGKKTNKKLKTHTSTRIVPLHKELLNIGFTDFVAERKKDKSSPKLFPELPEGNTGYPSNTFSKWFRRFLETVFGEKEANERATFHSFRHMVKDKLQEKGVSKEIREALCGWGTNFRRSSEAFYGKGFSIKILHEAINKIEYKGLDLSHLYKK